MLMTSLGSNDFNEVKGLETVNHEGSSWIGIDTIYTSNVRDAEVHLIFGSDEILAKDRASSMRRKDHPNFQVELTRS